MPYLRRIYPPPRPTLEDLVHRRPLAGGHARGAVAAAPTAGCGWRPGSPEGADAGAAGAAGRRGWVRRRRSPTRTGWRLPGAGPAVPGRADVLRRSPRAGGGGCPRSRRAAGSCACRPAPRSAPAATSRPASRSSCSRTRTSAAGASSTSAPAPASSPSPRCSSARAVVVAFDVDPAAPFHARDNRRLNGLHPRLFVGHLGRAARGAVFDLALVNVVPEQIRPEMPALAARLRPGGEAILSGILASAGARCSTACAAWGCRARAPRGRRLGRLPGGGRWSMITLLADPEELDARRGDGRGRAPTATSSGPGACRSATACGWWTAGAGRAGARSRGSTAARARVALGEPAPANEPAFRLELLVADVPARAGLLAGGEGDRARGLGHPLPHSERAPRDFGDGTHRAPAPGRRRGGGAVPPRARSPRSPARTTGARSAGARRRGRGPLVPRPRGRRVGRLGDRLGDERRPAGRPRGGLGAARSARRCSPPAGARWGSGPASCASRPRPWSGPARASAANPQIDPACRVRASIPASKSACSRRFPCPIPSPVSAGSG